MFAPIFPALILTKYSFFSLKTLSRTKWYLAKIYFVRAWYTGLCTMSSAGWLSTSTLTGTATPTSPCIWSWSCRRKLTSCAAAENPMYSDSQELRLAFPSSFDCQLTGPPADMITNAAREREVSGQVRWLESQ